MAFILWLFLALTLAPPPMTAKVSPRLQMEPGYVVVQLRIERHADNRYVDVAIDSGLFRRSTRVQLDGEAAPVTQRVDYRDVPGGAYIMTADLFGSRAHRARVESDFQIVSRF